MHCNSVWQYPVFLFSLDTKACTSLILKHVQIYCWLLVTSRKVADISYIFCSSEQVQQYINIVIAIKISAETGCIQPKL